MANSKDFGSMNLIGCYLVDGDPVAAKAQEVGKVTHFIDSLDEQVKVTIDVTKRYALVTANGQSMPTSIGVPSKRGTQYTYSQNGYHITVMLKKMVGTLTYVKEVKK